MGKSFKILTLNGGGSKGVYTLGVLNEVEKLLKSPLHNHFDLIYGTSTGSIIAAFIALGHPIDFILKKYYELIPHIMGQWGRAKKSKALEKFAIEVFGAKKFDAFKTKIGIVAMNYDYQRPFIFKNVVSQAHGMKSSFVPGFGLTIAEAIQCSCAAYPIFDKKMVTTENQGKQVSLDGGFVANNPTLFALIDATQSLEQAQEDLRVLNVGVGNYVEKAISLQNHLIGKFDMAKLVTKVLNANTNTNEILTKLLYPKLDIVVLNESFSQPEYGTNMVEKNLNKLELLQRLGRESFAKNETQISNLLLKT